MSARSLASQVLRYGLVGVTAVVVHYTIMFALLTFDVFVASIASTIGFIVSIPVNFLGQRHYVFSYDGNVYRQAMLYLVGLLISGFMNWMIVHLIVDKGLQNPLLGQIISSITVVGINYLYNRRITFR